MGTIQILYVQLYISNGNNALPDSSLAPLSNEDASVLSP